MGIHQSEAARRLGVSTVSMSKWERDVTYPVWEQQPGIVEYLGFDPFTNPMLGSRKSNETRGVAILSSDTPLNLGQQIVKRAMELRKALKEFAKELNIDPKTIRNWETGRKQPSRAIKERITPLLS